jgi:hypothetical protein
VQWFRRPDKAATPCRLKLTPLATAPLAVAMMNG